MTGGAGTPGGVGAGAGGGATSGAAAGAGATGPLGAAGAVLGGNTLATAGIGLLAGILASGGLLVTGLVRFEAGSGQGGNRLALLACPGSGQVLGEVEPGTKMLATARSADGSWLQVYFPGPGISRAWVPAGALDPGGATGTLPLAACEPSPTSTPVSVVESSAPTPEPTAVPPSGSSLKTSMHDRARPMANSTCAA